MYVWEKEKLAEKDIELALIDPLERFQVETVPPPPFSERLRNRLGPSNLWSLANSCGRWGWIISGVIVLEVIFVLLNYYDCYQSIYPGSTVAAAINRTVATGTVFNVFKGMICSGGVAITGTVLVMLLIRGMRYGVKLFPRWIVISFAIICLPVLIFLGTWQGWISFMLKPVLTNYVYNTACQGWDISADLQGVSWDNQLQSLPYVGTATVVLAYGNYSMQLERDETNHDVFTFYLLNTFNYTPPFSNVTYNFSNETYTIDNVTTKFTLEPNLQFPHLDLVLRDISIPFESTYGPPNADLIYRNGLVQKNVFNTVTTRDGDCTQLRACGMLSPKGSFEIAMGVVMIQQYNYSVSCTTPTDNCS
jgi:hypothetical protein